MNDYEKRSRMVQIAIFYYRNNLCQQEISEKLNISRSHVSKLLRESKQTGIVTFMINDCGFEQYQKQILGIRAVKR